MDDNTKPYSMFASPARGSTYILNPQLASKLDVVRSRAEQFGQVYTNLPRERYADVRFDDQLTPCELPPLRKQGFELAASPPVVSSSSPFFSPISPERMDIYRCDSSHSSSIKRIEYPLPYAADSMSCARCGYAVEMKRMYASSFIGNILSLTCSICRDSLSSSSTVRALSPHYPFPVSHECDACGWRVCLRCNIVETVQKGMNMLKQVTETETSDKFKSHISLLEQQLSQADTPDSATLAASFRAHMTELETSLATERKARDNASSLLASLQKEYIQYKSDVELHLESNAAEQVLLQSRLIEQSVLLADARARIDDLSSVHRRVSGDGSKDSDKIKQREALLMNENNHLKEEIDALKISMHSEFDNWKRSVLKQVKTECMRYQQKLKKSLSLEEIEDDGVGEGDYVNEKELDFIFDEVDWTVGLDELQRSPEKMKEYVSSRVSTPDKLKPNTLLRS